MGYGNSEIIARDGDAVLVVDRPANTWFESYSGVGSARKAKRVAIVLTDAEAASAFLEGDEGANARRVTTRRARSFARLPSRLRNCIALYDRYAQLDDDAMLKRAHPAPDGIDVTFRWDPRDQVYRLEALTERKGALTTRTVTLDPLDKRFDDAVRDAYARFLRTSPAPVAERGVRCGEHIARLLPTLGAPAVAQYAHWLRSLRSLPLHERGTAGKLVIPGLEIGKGVGSVILEPVHGRDEIAGTVTFDKAGSVGCKRLAVRADLPQTVLEAMPGRRAHEIWGLDWLEPVTVRRRSTPRTNAPRDAVEYDIEYPLSLAPQPDACEPDDERAARLLDANYSGYTFERTLSRTIGRLSPSWILHLVRALRHAGTDGLDVSYLPGAEVPRMILAGKSIRAMGAVDAPLHGFWRKAA